ncbi:hypothetical protein BZG36_03154 [Bifiguratus adelaidae]|uniref:Intradiol ring-cleavage dioxygenases domain-containing protein n=1 Tax=Bifiguratus adelaidae TaxID=1938954 RepID=A0A261Y120_9FUNG|nr:hypothetical protein BZG36_03154 [Bifiguratus adelaidae]
MDTFSNHLTEAVIATFKDTPERHRHLFASLVSHLHAFVIENECTTTEWMSCLTFLETVGKHCSEERNEFILLSDVLGVSALVDAINHRRPEVATPNTVLGPFFHEESPRINHADSIVHQDTVGERVLVKARVKNLRGEPIRGALIDVWETDGNGEYDVQRHEKDEPLQQDCRGHLYSNEHGQVELLALKPVAYPLPTDGPVGAMLLSCKRSIYRPAHVHFKITAQGYDPLVTALYTYDDTYVDIDAVFGVKEALKVKYERSLGKHPWLLCPEFILITEEEAQVRRNH